MKSSAMMTVALLFDQSRNLFQCQLRRSFIMWHHLLTTICTNMLATLDHLADCWPCQNILCLLKKINAKHPTKVRIIVPFRLIKLLPVILLVRLYMLHKSLAAVSLLSTATENYLQQLSEMNLRNLPLIRYSILELAVYFSCIVLSENSLKLVSSQMK